MVEFKLVLSTKDGKSYQKELKSPEADVLLLKKIGDSISGDSLGFAGYEFELRGGSDASGFPMRSDVIGVARRRILATKGLGVHIAREGQRVRKTVAGNAVGNHIAQINLKVIKAGKEPLAPAEAVDAPAEKAA